MSNPLEEQTNSIAKHFSTVHDATTPWHDWQKLANEIREIKNMKTLSDKLYKFLANNKEYSQKLFDYIQSLPKEYGLRDLTQLSNIESELHNIITITENIEGEIQVVFKEDVTPCTDGSTIYLPKNFNEDFLCELLAIVLHESFHIKFTNWSDKVRTYFERYSNSRTDNDTVRAIKKSILNTLEDIRIDYKATQLYPKSIELYHVLYYFICKGHKEQLMKEPLGEQIQKSLCLKNAGFPTFNPEVDAIIEKNNLDRYIELARKAPNYEVLLEVTHQLYADLKRILKDEMSSFNGGRNDIDGMKKQYKEQIDALNKALAELKTKLKELYDKAGEARKEAHSQHRKHATNETRSGNLRKQAEEASEKGDYKTSEHKDKLADAAESRADVAGDAYTEAMAELGKLQKEIDLINKLVKNADTEKYDISKYLDDLEKNGEQADSAGFGCSKVKLNGIEALKNQKVEYEHSYELPRSLDEVLREVFVQRREETEIDEDGARLCTRNLYRLCTDSQNLFTTNEKHEKETVVSFLLDASGSMGGNRSKRLLTAFDIIYKALTKVINNDNLPVKVGVFSFDDSLYTLKDFTEEKTMEQIAKQYYPRGSTFILDSMNKVSEKMKAIQSNNCKNILLLITDADVDDREISKIRNQANFEDCKNIFIGIDIQDYKMTKDKKALFKANLTEQSNTVKVLSDCLIDAIR